jgi:type IV secretion system protein VirB6
MQLHFNKYWFRLLLFVAYFLIIGCDSKNDMPFPRCISADYFGPKPIEVSAHFSSNHDTFIPEDGEVIDSDTGEINYGFHHNQVVKWKDTGLETNGDSLVVRVNGAWTSWSSNNSKGSQSNYSLQDLEKLRYETKFAGGKGNNSLPDFHLVCNDYKTIQQEVSNCSSESCKFINENDSTDGVSRSVPCWFTNGHGAYLLFKRGGDRSPNESLKIMRDPSSPTIHLGYNSTAEGEGGVFTLDKNSDKLRDSDCNVLKLKKGWKIYVKILDRYYLDNSGGYSFEFLGGVQQPSSFGFFDEVYKYLKCVLLINQNCEGYFNSNDPAAAQAMFENIVKEGSSFHNFVLSLLVLFIVISSLLYLFGMIQDTKQDMLIRMMKITLVVVLISPGSFQFFYNHFLILFVEGLEQLITIVTNFSPNSNTGSEVARIKLFSFMEDMFNKFFAYSVWVKFAAFLHSNPFSSILMVPVILIGIILYFLLCLYAFIIFISGFVGIAFLIAIMPLFLISILFSQLKSLFEGWIKFCISFCLQSVIIFTLLSLLAAIVMNTFYRQLGFTVCYNKWLEVRMCIPKLFCIIDNQYFGWTPGQVFVPYTIGEASSLNIDKRMEGMENMSRAGGTMKFTGGVGYIPLPPDYTAKGFRYVDYPFFNPIPGTNENPADHYIAESDIIVNKECVSKDLVRLTNSLLHASEEADVLSLMNNIDKNIDIEEGIKALYCQLPADAYKCSSYRQIIGSYKNGVIQAGLKNEIRSLVEDVLAGQGCQLLKLSEINKDYQDNSDYQRVQDINRGYLLSLLEILILFLLSSLMFSLRKFVQEVGTNIAGGGYSVYTISSMYNGSFLEDIKHKVQDKIASHVSEPLSKFATRLPNRLVGGTAHILGRIPGVGGALEQAINVPRKLINATIEVTKFATSPKNDVYKFEEAMYALFKKGGKGVSELTDIEKSHIFTHRRIDQYLKYYKGYVGSHLGYTLEDAMKFTWRHGLDSMGFNSSTGKKYGYQHNLLYRAQSHREGFLERLHDYTIGRTRKPPKYKDEGDNNKRRSVPSETREPDVEEGGE